MILYRPVGLKELSLIFDSGMKAFPPRLPEQPIFYPVTNFGYAEQINVEWNCTSGQFAGYVTTFEVQDDYVNRFEKKIVGGNQHEELWVPAEDLPKFNDHIEGNIEVDAGYFGDEFTGEIADAYLLKGKNAKEQIIALGGIADYNDMDFMCEVYAQMRVVYLHYPYWLKEDFTGEGLSNDKKSELLRKIEKRWEMSDIPFGLPRLMNNKAEQVASRNPNKPCS